MARFTLISLLKLAFVVTALKGHKDNYEYDADYEDYSEIENEYKVEENWDSENFKISGGSVATIFNFPYQLSLMSNNFPICGGFILSSTWTMTAAHCVSGKNTSILTIRVGSDYSTSGGEVYSVKTLFIHSLYNISLYDYDFALMEIKGVLTFGTAIKPVNLPNQYDRLPLFGQLAVAGWGRTVAGGAASPILMYTNVPVIPQFMCRAIYSSGGIYTDRMFCAGRVFSRKTSCSGDSGGAAVFKNVVVGIVSFGSSFCGDLLIPTVFAKVSTVVEWIKGVTGLP